MTKEELEVENAELRNRLERLSAWCSNLETAEKQVEKVLTRTLRALQKVGVK